MKIHVSEPLKQLLPAQYKFQQRDEPDLRDKVGGHVSYFLTSKDGRQALRRDMVQAMLPDYEVLMSGKVDNAAPEKKNKEEPSKKEDNKKGEKIKEEKTKEKPAAAAPEAQKGTSAAAEEATAATPTIMTEAPKEVPEIKLKLAVPTSQTTTTEEAATPAFATEPSPQKV